MIDEQDTQGRREGAVVGPYVLHEEIGRGGMGVVYRATRADTGLEVAVKLMLPELSSSIRFRERFIAEAQTAPKLDHPNIVPVHEAGGVDSELYIAMRLVHGADLKQVVEREGRLAPGRVAAILRQVSAALDYAHGVGVVHRDVKPQNILLSKIDDDAEDLVYITDFGLMKPAGSESTASRTSEVLGSIQYMAPEQIEGMPTDGRADVYSLGCVAFEALTGAIPFDRSNEVAVLWAHVHEDPPRVTDLRAELGGLDIVIATALAKHPDDRYLTCGEFSEAVREGLEKNQRAMFMPAVRPLVARIPRKKTEREVWAPNFFPELSRVRKLTNKTNWRRVAGVTAAVSLVASGLVQFAHPQGLAGAAQDVADVADSVITAVTDLGSGDEVASSEAGDQGDGRQRERRTRPGILPPNERGGPARGSSAGSRSPVTEFAAPSGDIVFVHGDHCSPCNGEDREIFKTDGKRIVQLTDNEAWDDRPSWSPNGKRIVFLRTFENLGETSPPPRTEIWVMDEDGTGQERVVSLGDLGDPEPYGSESWRVSWSPDGRRLVYSTDEGIFVVDIVGGEKRQLLGGIGKWPEWSPAGDSIVYSRRMSRATSALWVMGSDGSGQRQLTHPDEQREVDRYASWTPDGHQIVFSRGFLTLDNFSSLGDVANDQIFVIDVDGTDLREVTTADGRTAWWPSISKAGDDVVYVSDEDLYVIGIDGSNKRRLTTNGDNTAPDWR